LDFGPYHILPLPTPRICCAVSAFVFCHAKNLREHGSLKSLVFPEHQLKDSQVDAPKPPLILRLKLITAPAWVFWGTFHLKVGPSIQNLVCVVLRDKDSQKPGPFALCLHLGLCRKCRMIKSSKPSMRKETHCVYRYRIWHLRPESTLGLGGHWAGLIGHRPLPLALWPTCFPLLEARPQRWAGLSQPTLSSQTQPCLTSRLRPGENSQ
jgi:hypothetical protein